MARLRTDQSGRLLALLGERRLPQLGGVFLAYYIAARLSLLLSLVGHSVTPLWAPTGVAVAAILAHGYRLWPAVAVAAFAVNVPISPSPVAAAGIAVGNTAAPVVAVWLLRRLQFRTELARPRDALTLLVAGTAATTISASGGTASLVLSGAVAVGHFGSSWLVWWTGDAMGVVLVAPVLWSLRGPRPALSWLRVAEATGLLALLVGTVLLAASNQGPGLFIVRGREVRPLEPSHTSPPVGVRSGPLVPDQFELQPPDRLLLFTDGLLEGRDRAGRFFPLREVVAEILDTEDLDQALDDLMARYLRHVGGQVTDDIAILLAASQVLRLPALDPVTVAG